MLKRPAVDVQELLRLVVTMALPSVVTSNVHMTLGHMTVATRATMMTAVVAEVEEDAMTITVEAAVVAAVGGTVIMTGTTTEGIVTVIAVMEGIGMMTGGIRLAKHQKSADCSVERDSLHSRVPVH